MGWKFTGGLALTHQTTTHPGKLSSASPPKETKTPYRIPKTKTPMETNIEKYQKPATEKVLTTVLLTQSQWRKKPQLYNRQKTKKKGADADNIYPLIIKLGCQHLTICLFLPLHMAVSSIQYPWNNDHVIFHKKASKVLVQCWLLPTHNTELLRW